MKTLLILLIVILPIVSYPSGFKEIYDTVREKDTETPAHADEEQIENFRSMVTEFLDSDRTVLYKDTPEGQGIYFQKKGSAQRQIFVQIPHAFKDLYTRNIGVRLYATGAYIAASFNTAPRYIRKNGFSEIFDLAHSDMTYWQVFTEEFVRKYPSSAVVQLHGFAEEKRETQDARNADFIVSSGTKNPPSQVYELHGCLNKKGYKALLYPFETTELGGTTNSTLKMLLKIGYKNFVHLEMSRGFRDKAREGGKHFSDLHFCLTESLGGQR